MHIAFIVINANRREGTSRAILEVAERLAENHTVDLWARTVEDVDLKKLNWIKVPGPGRPEVGDFFSFKWIVDRRLKYCDYDIIHTPGPNTAVADVYAIQTVHPVKMQQMAAVNANANAGWARQLSRRLYDRQVVAAERESYTTIGPRGPRAFLPVSSGTKAELIDQYPVESANIAVVPNGADLECFHPANKERFGAQIRRQHGFAEDDFVAVFSGGDWRRKGLDLAIQALSLCEDERVKLLVVGDDPLGENLRALPAELGIDHRVCFAGFCRNVNHYYAAGDVFLFPTSYEAFSLASIEAAASGLPVLMPDVSGAAELVGDGETGTIIERAPKAIAETLRHYVKSPNRVIDAGIAARRLVEERFSWDAIAEQTLDVYCQLLEKKKAWTGKTLKVADA